MISLPERQYWQWVLTYAFWLLDLKAAVWSTSCTHLIKPSSKMIIDLFNRITVKVF